MMTDHARAVEQHAVDAVKKPVNAWRRTITAAGAIVARPWRRYRASIFQGYVIGAIVVFLVLAVLAKTVAYFAFDVTITHALQTFNGAWFDSLMRTLTWIGFGPQADLIALAILIFLYASGLKWETVVAFVSLVGSTAVGLGIKVLVDRPRPSADVVNVITQLKDYSFPSGHVLFFVTFFGFMVFLAYTLLKHSWWRTGLLVLMSSMVALIGPSRIYMGHHWASDVIAAYLLGSVWLAFSVLIYRRGKTRFFVDEPAAKETSVKGNAP